MEAVLRTFRLIDCLAINPGGLGVNRLAAMVELAPSTTHRYMATLQDLGYVSQGPDKSYKLTTRMYAVGLSAVAGSSTDEQIRTSLERLALVTAETVMISVRDGLHSVCIAQRESNHRLKITAHPGSRQDLRLGASSRVLLAFVSDEELDAILNASPIKQLTSATVTDPSAIRALVKKVRTDGYCVSSGEIDTGVFGVAAPVKDNENRVVAALSVVAPASRAASEEEKRPLIDAVVAESIRLSPLIGRLSSSAFVFDADIA